jgi:Zn-dependent protease
MYCGSNLGSDADGQCLACLQLMRSATNSLSPSAMQHVDESSYHSEVGELPHKSASLPTPRDGTGSSLEVRHSAFAETDDEKAFREMRALLFAKEKPSPPKDWWLVWRLLNAKQPRKAGPILLRTLMSRRGVWLALSVVVFVLTLIGILSPLDLLIFVGVLFFHELGHYLGMMIFGYRDVRMFFIPFFGAAVAGKKAGAPLWQQAIILLLGPLPGLVVGCVLYFWNQAHSSTLIHQTARWLVYLNFLNLLPFEPLDGGKFLNAVLFSRDRNLQSVARVAMALGLTIVCWPASSCLAIGGGLFLLLLAVGGRSIAKAAGAVRQRWASVPSRLEELSEFQLRDVFLEVRRCCGRNTQIKPSTYASFVKEVHEQTLLQPVSSRATLVLLGVYSGVIMLSLITFFKTNLRDDAGHWPMEVLRMSPESEPKS